MSGVGARTWSLFCLFAFLVSFGIATAVGFLKPYTNWDMAAYVGAAISWQERRPDVLHQKMLEDVERGVSARWRREIAEANARSGDSRRFVQNLPFYTTKPAYVAAVWLFRASGLTRTYSAATWAVSALSFGVLSILLLCWPPERIPRSVWLLALAVFCWFGNHPFSTVARFSTPDSMALIPVAGAFLAMLRLRRPRTGMALMLFAVLIRPETVILNVMLAAFFFGMDEAEAPLSKKQSLFLGAMSILLYFSIQKLFGGYGYEKFFYYTFVHNIPNPAEVEAHWSLKDYGRALASGIRNASTDSRLFPFLLLSAAAAFCRFRIRPARSVYARLLLLAWANYAVRFLLAPSWQEYRYYSVNYLLMLIASCEMIACCFRRARSHESG